MHIDWTQLFRPDTPILEIVFRGSVIYLALFALLRIGLKREAGSLGLSDLLVIVLLADAAQNAMAGQYNSLTDGLVLVATLVFWSYALDWLSYRYPQLGRFIDPPSLVIIREGRMEERELRRQLITEDQVLDYLRAQGVEELSEVYRAYLSGNGHISVITYSDREHRRWRQWGSGARG